MEISLKKISINGALSEETICFSATVLIDGKPAFEAQNRGNGGCHDYHPLKGQDYAEMRRRLEAAETYAKTLPSRDFDGSVLPMDLELLISTLVADHDIKRIITRAKNKFGRELSTRIFAVLNDKLVFYRLRPNVSRAVYESAIEKAKPGIRILRGSPEEQWAIARPFIVGDDTNA